MLFNMSAKSQDLLLEDGISFHLKLCCLVTAVKF